uniref:Progonadoliberin-1 n=1 Tax=Myripristis murdjan TaxID=586833 RepID=A0A667Z8F1_9TELE
MERTTLVLWLLLLGTLMPQGCCQHWSYGLSPGGKRELDSLSDTLASIVGAFPQTDIPCSVLGCAEESPFAKLHRLKGLLVSVAPFDTTPGNILLTTE